ncbi:fumarylacetoacetate hydrolase family protein [Celerinatantimonas yamalensis]|uniref:Fumarylacetoacetate hydrolase family protein n=1 Tax=Celerinatantimonas yamalensis TaxID=559956 RepID=A0ABW9G9J0_9GAMM
MKFASYQYGHHISYGVVQGDRISDLGGQFEHYPDLKSFLAHGVFGHLADKLSQCHQFSCDEVTFLPVIPNPGKIFCVGMNYAQKRQEFGENNPAPTLFVRFADSQVGHRQPVIKPFYSKQFDYEGELAVVIGRSGHHIAVQDALNYVAGYSCYMDGSARDWQHAWFTAGKNWRQTGAFGPWLVSADEITDPHQLTLMTWFNGQQVQQDSTANMVHKIPELIHYISTFSELNPGDVIITGSPGGVGKKRNPPLFLQPGDLIEVEISQIGRLSNRVIDDDQVGVSSVIAQPMLSVS